MPAYKDAQRNTWFAKFKYKNREGEIKSVTKRGFVAEQEALQWEREFLLKHKGSMKMSFSSFVEVYREDHTRLKENTSNTKDNIITTKLVPYFGSKPMEEITVTDVRQWLNELLHYQDPVTSKPYSQAYVKTVFNQLKAIFNHAVLHYKLKENPASGTSPIETTTTSKSNAVMSLKVFVKNHQETFLLIRNDKSSDSTLIEYFSSEAGNSIVNFLYNEEYDAIIDALLHSTELIQNIKSNPADHRKWKPLLPLAEKAKSHPFYFLILSTLFNAYENKMKDEEGFPLPNDFLAQLGESYKQLKSYIQNFSETFLDFTESDISHATRYATTYSPSSEIKLSRISIEPISLNLNPMGKATAFAIGEVMYPQSPEEIGQYLFYKYLQEGVEYKHCDNCGKYFLATGRSNVKYCSHLLGDSKRSCRQIMPKVVLRVKEENNPVEKIFNTAYKTMYSRVSTGKISKETFKAWSKEARQKRNACTNGKMDISEYTLWLKESLAVTK